MERPPLEFDGATVILFATPHCVGEELELPLTKADSRDHVVYAATPSKNFKSGPKTITGPRHSHGHLTIITTKFRGQISGVLYYKEPQVGAARHSYMPNYFRGCGTYFQFKIWILDEVYINKEILRNPALMMDVLYKEITTTVGETSRRVLNKLDSVFKEVTEVMAAIPEQAIFIKDNPTTTESLSGVYSSMSRGHGYSSKNSSSKRSRRKRNRSPSKKKAAAPKVTSSCSVDIARKKRDKERARERKRAQSEKRSGSSKAVRAVKPPRSARKNLVKKEDVETATAREKKTASEKDDPMVQFSMQF